MLKFLLSIWLRPLMMGFTNVWDTTFPPDTQLANLLGQDIRNGVKVDVQQRMAAISGLDASKPNFAGDAQPANWNGILFFATDTGQIYKFANPGWTNVTAQFIPSNAAALRNNAVVTNAGNTTLNTIYTITVPGNSMGSNGILDITIPFSFSYTANSANIFIDFAATIVVSFNINVGDGPGNTGVIRARIRNVGATNSQRIVFDALIGNVTPITEAAVATSAIDTTVNQNVVVKCQNITTAGNSTSFEGISVQYL